jgi:hypothetical protein
MRLGKEGYYRTAARQETSRVVSWRESFPRGVVVGNLPRGALASLTGGLHAQKNSCRETPSHPIHALREEADMELPTFLLNSKSVGAI